MIRESTLGILPQEKKKKKKKGKKERKEKEKKSCVEVLVRIQFSSQQKTKI